MEPNQPLGYRLEESDPDVLILRRPDGAFVAAFSAKGATKESIRETVEDDQRALLRRHNGPPGPPTSEYRIA